MRTLVVKAIKFYQLAISPFMGRNCRFYPTCSEYTLDAITEHGLLKGLALTVKRIGKCHPWHDGGYDPVPTSSDRSK
jgi:putative membrane protein insertion efficiency factor